MKSSTQSRRARGALVVTACLLVTALAGCGSGKGSTGGEALTPESSGTVTIWSYVDNGTNPWIEPAIARFNETYPDVKVDWEYVPYDQFVAKTLAAGTAGNAPDGLFFNPSDAAKLAEAGIVANITDFWNSYEDADQFPDSVVWKLDDEVISVQGYINTTAFWYNQDILDKVGIEVPTTIDELDSALAAVKAAGYEGMLVSGAAAGGEFDIFPWTLAYGQNYGAWDRDTLIEIFDKFGGWLDAGYIPRDITSWAQNDNYPRFAAGNTAFAQLGNWSLGSARDDIGFNFGVAELPAGPDGSHSIGGGEGFSLTTSAKNPDWVRGVFQSMFLDQQSEITMLNTNGCIPARADAASDPAIASDPKLAAYAEVVKHMGARPTTPLISDYLVEFGTVWNSFVGGQIDAAQAADELIAKTSKL